WPSITRRETRSLAMRPPLAGLNCPGSRSLYEETRTLKEIEHGLSRAGEPAAQLGDQGLPGLRIVEGPRLVPDGRLVEPVPGVRVELDRLDPVHRPGGSDVLLDVDVQAGAAAQVHLQAPVRYRRGLALGARLVQHHPRLAPLPRRLDPLHRPRARASSPTISRWRRAKAALVARPTSMSSTASDSRLITRAAISAAFPNACTRAALVVIPT